MIAVPQQQQQRFIGIRSELERVVFRRADHGLLHAELTLEAAARTQYIDQTLDHQPVATAEGFHLRLYLGAVDSQLLKTCTAQECLDQRT
ncbi:hypothetical protein D3C76_1356390 [compost metagenome]